MSRRKASYSAGSRGGLARRVPGVDLGLQLVALVQQRAVPRGEAVTTAAKPGQNGLRQAGGRGGLLGDEGVKLRGDAQRADVDPIHARPPGTNRAAISQDRPVRLGERASAAPILGACLQEGLGELQHARLAVRPAHDLQAHRHAVHQPRRHGHRRPADQVGRGGVGGVGVHVAGLD